MSSFFLLWASLIIPSATCLLPASAPLVLFFVPVGVKQLEFMRDNVAALKENYPPLEFFFAHYDGVNGRNVYEKEAWYREQIGSHSCAYEGTKPIFLYRELAAGLRLRTDPWLRRFRFIWVADDNIDFRGTDALVFIALFARSGAAIGQPAVKNSVWSHITWPNEHNMHAPCAFRYVPVVEVSFFFFYVYPTFVHHDADYDMKRS